MTSLGEIIVAIGDGRTKVVAPFCADANSQTAELAADTCKALVHAETLLRSLHFATAREEALRGGRPR